MSSLKNNYYKISGETNNPASRAMTDDGTISGNDEIIGDYSVTEGRFWIQPPADEDWLVAGFTIAVSDAGNKARTDYGAITGGLTNGVNFFVEQEGVEIVVTQGNPIKDNQGLVRNGREFQLIDFDGQDDTIFTSDLLLAYSDGFVLRGGLSEKFGVLLNDDFTSLTQHQVFTKLSVLGKRTV